MSRWSQFGWICIILAVVLGILTVIAAQVLFFNLKLEFEASLLANATINRMLLLEIVLLISGAILVIVGRVQKSSRGSS